MLFVLVALHLKKPSFIASETAQPPPVSGMLWASPLLSFSLIQMFRVGLSKDSPPNLPISSPQECGGLGEITTIFVSLMFLSLPTVLPWKLVTYLPPLYLASPPLQPQRL